VTHFLRAGCDVRSVRELLGHRGDRATVVDAHVLKCGGYGELCSDDSR